MLGSSSKGLRVLAAQYVLPIAIGLGLGLGLGYPAYFSSLVSKFSKPLLWYLNHISSFTLSLIMHGIKKSPFMFFSFHIGPEKNKHSCPNLNDFLLRRR